MSSIQSPPDSFSENLHRHRRPFLAAVLAAAGYLGLVVAAASTDNSGEEAAQAKTHSISLLTTTMEQKGYDVLDSRLIPEIPGTISSWDASVTAAVGSKCVAKVNVDMYKPDQVTELTVTTNPDLGAESVDSLNSLVQRNAIPTLEQLMARPLVERSCA